MEKITIKNVTMLLSVVIPTKNRQQYCKAAVNQILSLNLPDLQVVIQDNSENDSLKSELREYIEHNRIKYHYKECVISFVDNFSEAISLCDGEYICMIGDDDGILPNIINVTKSAKERNIDCIIAGLNAVYIWPSPNSIVKNGEHGYLCLSYVEHKERHINCQKGLYQLVDSAGQNYQNLDLPRVYHGIAKRSALEKAKDIAGNYFQGLTPDIFIAVALASVCKNVIRIYYPITISGICPRSGSSDSATGKHTGELKDAPHFKGHTNYVWNEKSPAIYSVESIWAETALQALLIFGHKKLYDEFNVGLLDAICLKKYPQYKDIIMKHVVQNKVNVKFWSIILKVKETMNAFRRIIMRISHLKSGVKKFYNIANISQATKIVIREYNVCDK